MYKQICQKKENPMKMYSRVIFLKKVTKEIKSTFHKAAKFDQIN